jgi:hypothetical protein
MFFLSYLNAVNIFKLSSCKVNFNISPLYRVVIYCDVLVGNVSNNLWVLHFMLGLLVIHQAEFTVTYYSLNLTVLHILYRLTSCILLPLLFTSYWLVLNWPTTQLLLLTTVLFLCYYSAI